MEIVEKNKCTGCTACLNICPTNCISMISDSEGFLYPVIDEDDCIGCLKCRKICPVNLLNSQKIKKYANWEQEAYACYNIDSTVRMKSSSGGIFFPLAEYVIEQGGVVFGAFFDKDYSVIHGYTDDKDELFKFCGTKYVQSAMGETFRKVRDQLDEDRMVLFSGTPCQVSGLKSYLPKGYENLICIDFICHGVPSPLVWNKYLEYLKNKYRSEIKNIEFRNKEQGWSNYSLKILFNNNSIYSEVFRKDPYLKGFINDYFLRPSCYQCCFKGTVRSSDITLADYWGIKSIDPDMFEESGVSLLFINSEKGSSCLKRISHTLRIKETDKDRAAEANPSMLYSSKRSEKRNHFFQELEKKPISRLLSLYINGTIGDRIMKTIKKIYNRLRKLI